MRSIGRSMQIHVLFLNSIYDLSDSAQETVVISPLLFTEMPFYDMALSQRQHNGYFARTLKDAHSA